MAQEKKRGRPLLKVHGSRIRKARRLAAQGAGLREISTALKVSRRTLSRWIKNPKTPLETTLKLYIEEGKRWKDHPHGVKLLNLRDKHDILMTKYFRKYERVRSDGETMRTSTIPVNDELTAEAEGIWKKIYELRREINSFDSLMS